MFVKPFCGLLGKIQQTLSASLIKQMVQMNSGRLKLGKSHGQPLSCPSLFRLVHKPTNDGKQSNRRVYKLLPNFCPNIYPSFAACDRSEWLITVEILKTSLRKSFGIFENPGDL